MIFKDRTEAGRKLLVRLYQDRQIIKNKRLVVVVSLLRGGIIVGNILAQGLQVKHLPLVVAKIPSPHNPELAIGALCFNVVYLEKSVVSSLRLRLLEISRQINFAKKKFDSYLKRFKIKENLFSRSVKNKLVILTDDGIATGSSIKAALLYLKSKTPRTLILAVPVAPTNFSTAGVNKEYFLQKNPNFSAVSQFYQSFSQVEDRQVKALLQKSEK